MTYVWIVVGGLALTAWVAHRRERRDARRRFQEFSEMMERRRQRTVPWGADDVPGR